MAGFRRIGRLVCVGVAGSALALGAAISVRAAQSDADAAAPLPTASPDMQTDARDWSDSVPAHIAVVDGTVSLERDGSRDAAAENTPLLTGDRLRSERGRAEVLFADGSALDVDEQTTIDLLSDSLLRLEGGRVRLTLARGSASSDYRVDAAGTTTLLHGAGEYLLMADPDSRSHAQVRASVIRGSAEIGNGSGRTLIRPGYEAAASADATPSAPYAANVAAWDDFDRWADNLWQDRTSATASRYLPAEVRPYGGLFDRYGDWQYDSSYGYVWYPRVDVTWRPYYQGEWSYVGAFGWTWIGVDRWSWATHHYGRWGFRGARWYWIPGASWAPAWVSWASAPGYLSWCPLGYDNRAVIAIGLGYGYGSAVRGWTAIPLGRYTSTILVNGRTRASSFPGGARFVEGRAAPIRPAGVVRDNRAPLRGPAFSASARAASVTSRGVTSYNSSNAPSRAASMSSYGSRSWTAHSSPAPSAPVRTDRSWSPGVYATAPRSYAAPSPRQGAPSPQSYQQRVPQGSTGVPRYSAPDVGRTEPERGHVESRGESRSSGGGHESRGGNGGGGDRGGRSRR